LPVYDEVRTVGYGDDLFRIRDTVEIDDQRVGLALVEGKASYDVDYKSVGLVADDRPITEVLRGETFSEGFFVEESLDSFSYKERKNGLFMDDTSFQGPFDYEKEGLIEYSPLYWVGGILGYGTESDFPLNNLVFRLSGLIGEDEIDSYERQDLLTGILANDTSANFSVAREDLLIGVVEEQSVDLLKPLRSSLIGVFDAPLFSSGLTKIGGAGYIPDESKKLEAYYEYGISGVIESEILGDVKKEVVEFTAIVEIGKYSLILELPEGEEVIAFSGATFDEFVSPDRRKVGGIVTFTEEKLFIIETSKDRVFRVTVKPIYPWRRGILSVLR